MVIHRAVYVVSWFRCSAAQTEFLKKQYSNLSARKIHFQSMTNVHIDVFIIIIRKIFTLFIVYSKREHTLESVSMSGRLSIYTITFERRVRS